MPSFDQGPSSYGIQTINQRGQSNAGQQGGYGASYGLGGGSGMRGPYGWKSPEDIAREQQELAQRRLLAAQQQAERAGQQNEQMVQQQMQQAAPVQNYVDTWQMTPEKIAAYRAQQQNGTSMGQQQQPGISNGQMNGQQALYNLLRMLGLG